MCEGESLVWTKSVVGDAIMVSRSEAKLLEPISKLLGGVDRL
jgi:hypothetical protein